MNNKYTKRNGKNNRNNRNNDDRNRGKRQLSNEKEIDKSFIDNSLIDRIVASEDDFKIDIIGGRTIDEDDDFEVNTVDIMDDEQDEELASRLSMYENMDDNVKEYISRDHEIVSESRRRVNQPGRRKYPDKDKSAKEGIDSKKATELKKKKNIDSRIRESKKEKNSGLMTLYNQHKAGILYGTLAALMIVLVIVIIALPKNGTSNEPEENSVQNAEVTNLVETGTENTTVEETTVKNITVADLTPEAEDSEIHKLIVGFIDAERIKLDETAAKSYLDNDANYSLTKHKDKKRYIEAYQNIKCYKFDYISDDMYYVYVAYDLKILNIDTPAVAGEPLVVKYDKAQKKYFIHNILEGEAGDLLIAWNAPEVKALNEDVLKRYNEAINSDEDLKKFLDIMNSKTETTTEATTVSGTETETTGESSEETTVAN